MKSKRVAVYFRYASIEALEESNIESGHRNAWLFERRNNAPDKELQAMQMKAFREKCEASGYTIIGETVIEGDSKMTLPAIQNILQQETDVHYILSPAIRALSRRADEALKTVKYMNDRGVIFKSADGGELTVPRTMIHTDDLITEINGISSDNNAKESNPELEEMDESDAPQLSM